MHMAAENLNSQHRICKRKCFYVCCTEIKLKKKSSRFFLFHASYCSQSMNESMVRCLKLIMILLKIRLMIIYFENKS